MNNNNVNDDYYQIFIFKTIFKQIKEINNALQYNVSQHSGIMDHFILSLLYDIKPILNVFNRLFNNDKQFFDEMQYSMPQQCDIYPKYFRIINFIPHIWRSTNEFVRCFPNLTECYMALCGYPNMLAALSAKGDFTFYNKFIKKQN